MKRIISLMLCMAMLMGMVVTTVSAENWGDSGVWGGGDVVTPEYEQIYASNGTYIRFDTTSSNSKLYVQTFDDSSEAMTGDTSVAGNCGMEWTSDKISTAYSNGTGVTTAMINEANNAWKALSPSQKNSLA